MPDSSGEMRVIAEPGASKFTLQFAGADDLSAFFTEALAQQAFLLRLDSEPESFATFAFAAGVEGGEALNFQATVVQTFESGGGFQAAFQFTDWNEALDRQLKAEMDSLSPIESSTSPAVRGETFGTAPVFHIKELDTGQRVVLALKADRGERAVLCRDTMAPVLLNLLSNPQLDSENVLAIAKSPYASPDILQRVGSDRRWLASADVRIALVRNPKTPTPLAQRLLETLPLAELRILAKTGNSKEDLRRLALALVTKSHTSR